MDRAPAEAMRGARVILLVNGRRDAQHLEDVGESRDEEGVVGTTGLRHHPRLTDSKRPHGVTIRQKPPWKFVE